MKKLIIIFTVLFVLTLLGYLTYNVFLKPSNVSFFIKQFGQMDTSNVFNWRSFKGLHTFNDHYTAKRSLKNLKLQLSGVNTEIYTYNGTRITYTVNIESNFDLKLKREIVGDTLILKTYSQTAQTKNIKKSKLVIKVPKTTENLNGDFVGLNYAILSCIFDQVIIDATGTTGQIVDSSIKNLNVDLTGAELNAKNCEILSSELKATGAKVNFENLKSQEFSTNITGGKMNIGFKSYNNVQMHLTGGSATINGIDKKSNFNCSTSVGYIDLFGDKHFDSFLKNGEKGKVVLSVTAGNIKVK